MHVSFIHILLPQFLMGILVNIFLFKVGHLPVRIGTLDACVRDDFWHLWVGEGWKCLGHDDCLTDISVGIFKIPIHILHHLGDLYKALGTRLKRSLHQPLKLVSASSYKPWVLVWFLLPCYLFGLGSCPFCLSVDFFNSVTSGGRGGLVLIILLWYLLLLY